jgi:hypothetical protein
MLSEWSPSREGWLENLRDRSVKSELAKLLLNSSVPAELSVKLPQPLVAFAPPVDRACTPPPHHRTVPGALRAPQALAFRVESSSTQVKLRSKQENLDTTVPQTS